MPDLLIFGSCVSRDTKAHFPEGWDVPVYIARQSMISAASGPSLLPGESALESAFQNRMIEWDQQGNGFRLILEALPAADLLLIDLVDERRGVWEVGTDQYVTNSFEMQQSGLISQQKTAPRLIPFGTDEHFDLWCAAAEKFVAALRGTRISVLVFAPAWAITSLGGKEMVHMQKSAREWNALYKRYHAHLQALGLPLITAPDDLTVADEEHIWGLEPFHYVKPFYHYMRDQAFAHIT